MNNGRRKFLSNIALLSAGFAIGAPVSMASERIKLKDDLNSKWLNLCDKLEGKSYHGIYTTQPSFYLKPCSGHLHEVGKPISIADGRVLVIPLWIYWQNSYKPADVVISFYNLDGFKYCTLNRFEMEALLNLDISPGMEIELLQLLKNNPMNKSLVVTICNTAIGKDSIKTTGNFYEKYKNQPYLSIPNI